MASRLSSRERKLLEFSPNKKAKDNGGIALEIDKAINLLVNVQDELIYKSFTNEFDDEKALSDYNKALDTLNNLNVSRETSENIVAKVGR